MVIKLGLASLPPFWAAALRFSLAFLVLLIYSLVKGYKIPLDFTTQKFFILFGILNFSGGYALVYWGEQYINSGLASVLFAVMPFYVIVLSVWMLPEDKVSLRKFGGVMMGFIGTVIIFGDQIRLSEAGPNLIYGMIALLISPLFSAVGTILGKKSISYHPITLTTVPLGYGALSFFIMSFLLEGGKTAEYTLPAVFSVFYLGILGTAIAFVLYFWLLRSQSAVLLSMITFVTPPLALIWGWLIFDEQITLFLVGGLVLILAGIYLVRSPRSQSS
jgi:drug/metabolite transporter (DMT)-like permease